LGALPDLIVTISDERLLELLKLLLSIPTPPPGPPEPPELTAVPTPTLKDRAKMKAIAEVNEVDEDTSDTEVDTETEAMKEQQVQLELSILLHVVRFLACLSSRAVTGMGNSPFPSPSPTFGFLRPLSFKPIMH
jgi:hypothetical protein